MKEKVDIKKKVKMDINVSLTPIDFFEPLYMITCCAFLLVNELKNPTLRELENRTHELKNCARET
jgi:hypothetical protein